MENCRTPRKVMGCPAASVQQFYKKTSPGTFKFINNHFKTQLSNTQKSYGKISQCSLGTQTPDKRNVEFMSTPDKRCLSSTAKSFHMFPLANSPSSENIRKKIVNPFEAALTERLHLPLICSPSLFQRPSTPQYSSSTNFEWTIEEVSSIGPANVEPHETQFQDVLDPEIEARTQAAISSFFKEQQIVPSPVDCPLRKQRIVLASAEAVLRNSPSVIRPAKRIRDGIAQTILTLPPVLPSAIEESLKPFFNFLQNQQQSPSSFCDKSNSLIEYHEARDASLRRKLFAVPNLAHDDTFDADDDENEIFQSSAFNSPPPKSPDLVEDTVNESEKEHSNSGFDKNSFGSLSPISKLSSDSPNPKRFSSEKRFIDTLEPANISPIKLILPPNTTIQQSKVVNSTSLHQQKLSDNVNNSFINNFTDSHLYRSTPDNSIQLKNSSNETQLQNDMSVDSSFNCKVSRLLVNSCLRQNDSKMNAISKSKSMTEVDIFDQNEFDEDDMQVSQLSEKSSNSSQSSNADTPRRSKKTPSRKNLSRSFSSHISDDEDIVHSENFCKDIDQIFDTVQNRKSLLSENSNHNDLENANLQLPEKCVFYRVDSGFNEMTNTQDDTKFAQIIKSSISTENVIQNLNNLENEDISMISCSTPSRKVF